VSKYLIEEQPIVLQPTLIYALGYTAATILQQIHWWCGINAQKNQNFKKGFHWVYNTREGWSEQFWFLNERTVWDCLTDMRKLGVVVAEILGDDPRDRTLWYRIDFDKLEQIANEKLEKKPRKHHAGRATVHHAEKALMQGDRKGADGYKESNVLTDIPSPTPLKKGNLRRYKGQDQTQKQDQPLEPTDSLPDGKITDESKNGITQQGLEHVPLPAAAPYIAPGSAMAQKMLWDSIRTANPNASAPAFQALWDFLCSPVRRGAERAKVDLAETRIPYWLEMPEAYILELVKLARNNQRVTGMSNWSACQYWLENTSRAVADHPHLETLLKPDAQEHSVLDVITDLGQYLTPQGRYFQIVEIYDGIAVDENEKTFALPLTRGWVKTA
jgi:hypothetical protein